MKELLHYIISSITGSDDFEIKEVEEDSRVDFKIIIDKEFIGLIIGKGGKTIQSIRNLLKIKGQVPIIIGGNYDDISKSNILALLDDLKEMGFKDEIKEIAFKPILGFPNHEKKSIHKIKACTFSETNVDDFFWLVQETEKRGFTPMKKIALGPCEAVRDNSFTIDPSGGIYKCSAMAGRK